MPAKHLPMCYGCVCLDAAPIHLGTAQDCPFLLPPSLVASPSEVTHASFTFSFQLLDLYLLLLGAVAVGNYLLFLSV